jgi:hypothetical protein
MSAYGVEADINFEAWKAQEETFSISPCNVGSALAGGKNLKTRQIRPAISNEPTGQPG